VKLRVLVEENAPLYAWNPARLEAATARAGHGR
jgi:hypothetical protein